jgi:cation diffusion facilitator CzcD-associated flavoprotein CzcO
VNSDTSGSGLGFQQHQGCGSDVAGHWYSLSTDLNPNWERRYPSQPELRDYWDGLWRKYDLVKHTRLRTPVKFASWDSKRQVYDVVVLNPETGVEEQVEANVMFYALGGFQAPRYPAVGGLETFKGVMFHSAKWNHDVDFKGKRVGVIGNGCSA